MSLPPGTVRIGDPAPDFDLSDTHGVQHRLSALAGSPVALVFFPFAFTGVCTSELRRLAELYAPMTEVGSEVLAVSTDTRYALRVFAEAESLPFTLLSDFWPHGAVAQAYGSFDPDRGCAQRASFVLAADHTVSWVDRSDLARPRDLTAQLEALGQVTGQLAANAGAD